ncbi:VENT homeobox 2, gene 2 L homeolog [Xenopus laevis]|uniref:Homeobox protein n=1 Tax=Xenopus laevis TaxID=8355 RepID=Q91914_XENLA|nr:VENT homeobox 2, gene 2 L homeolog [Xenopus laevis]AAI69626.1 Homeobox protein [Xenopus laevis]AAI69628.1 Homeobox protein [Xenopus laevis]CAA67093.1 homeobox protein [Xenopus laevis]
MTKAFSSVEWLAQSSRRSHREQPSKVDQRYSPYPSPSLPSWNSDVSPSSWNSQLSPDPDSAQVSPCPASAQVSPYSSDSEISLYSHEEEASFYGMDLNTSSSPGDNGLLHSEMVSVPDNIPRASSDEDAAKSAYSTSTDSGYESETSCSSSTAPEGDAISLSPNDTSDEEGKMGRRLRTAFTSDQISTLEKTFQKHRYLGASERQKLAAKLQLSEVQIKTWFQNRRMKYKREIQDGRPDSYHPAQFFGVYGYAQQPTPVFQHAVQHPYPGYNPLMETLPGTMPYTMHPPAMDSMTPFNSQPFQMLYLPQQHLGQPLTYQEERPFVRY